MKLIFKKGIAPQFNGDLTKLLRDYDVEQRSEYLLNIENILRRADASFDNSLNKGQELFWNFQTSENSITARRFQKFLPMVFRSKKTDFFLYEYQNKGVEWLRASKQGILADDMGLGKSLQVLKACELEIYNNKVPTVFIFCPNSLVKNWVSELDSWFPLANYAEFSKFDTRSQVSNFTFLITPYSKLESFVRNLKEFITKETISIFDEAHKLRNEVAKISRSSMYIETGHKWLLTGTPLERDTKDIDTILRILNPSLAANKLTKDPFLLKSRFKNITLRRTKLGVLRDLPKVSKHIHYVELSSGQREDYDSLLKKYKKTVRKEKIGILTELMMAATIGSDSSSSKINKALEICTEQVNNNNKIIIFSKFNKILDLMLESLKEAKIDCELVTGVFEHSDRNFKISRFRNDEDCKVLVINLAVGSEGLTLTEANNVIFLNEAWNPSMNRQAEDRVNRLGQRKPVNIHIIRSLDTIDIALEKILDNKFSLETEYVDELINRLV